MKPFRSLDSRNQAYSLRELLEANIALLWAQAIEVSQAIDADADRAATLAALTHPPAPAPARRGPRRRTGD